MIRNIKLTIEYDGTRFKGWQSQKNSPLTIQSKLKKAIKKITRESVQLCGSGRTDKGVHAHGQVAHFKTESILPPERILKALNAVLPEDIAIRKVQEVPLSFHAQYNVRTKSYRYIILNRASRSALDRKVCLHVPFPLDIDKMKKGAAYLIGRKNFKSFQASDPARSGRNTVRTIKRLDINKKRDIITIDIEADGFLYKMVRNIVGTLIDIGSGRKTPGSMRNLLAKKNRIYAGSTAKAHGLTLRQVKY